MNDERIEVSSASAPPASGSYSQGVRVGQLLFLSGQGPFEATGALLRGSVAEQLQLTMSNLDAVAQAGGAALRTCGNADQRRFSF